MLTTPSRDELDELARKFKSWRQQHPRKYTPRAYWAHAAQLAELFSVKTVAKRVGVEPSALRRKIKREQRNGQCSLEKVDDLQFVEVPPQAAKQILKFDQTVTMRVQNPKGLQIDLSFTSDIGELFPLLKNLIKEE